ncbi:hypothetical protein [Alkalicoccus chagannorensis]|uniref:hypothetical protein n=1 Tax=Alkalicoccus chagannorensis TaxID=427072 RepID=UPI0003FFC767|nr:hypothetical protein [Alkalicoccus chagannorensis]
MLLRPEQLPSQERATLLQLQRLPSGDKQLLWQLLLHTNKDHVCTIKQITPGITRLEDAGLISRNTAYQNRGTYSYYVLRNAPHLMKKLHASAQKKGGLSDA